MALAVLWATTTDCGLAVGGATTLMLTVAGLLTCWVVVSVTNWKLSGPV